ncbi:MAG: RNA polymerase sigma factor [Solirubrobacteraceae bacterium]
MAEADEAAFAVLYERHYQALYRYCRSIVRDDLDAQDALQTAWTGVLVALRHGRRDAPVRPWLYRIVHNEAITLLRRRRSAAEPTATLAHGDRAVALAHGAPSAEESAIARERFTLLMTDLGRLPERPRGALLMRELSGLTHEEIAAALETSVAAAKQCVYEARRDLAELAAGRATPCDEICRRISAGDRRVLRGRRVAAHLSDCPSCASFASAIDERRGALHAMVPWLPVPAAITVLDQVLRAGPGAGVAGSGSAGAVGAGTGAGGAGATTAGAGGPIAVAGSAAPATVAGGVVTKALGISLLGKAVVVAAAVTAGVASLGGVGAIRQGAARPATGQSARLSAHAAGAARTRSTAVWAAAPGQSSGRPGRGVAAGHAAGAVPSGQAKKGAVAVPPGQARKAGAAVPPGRAKHAGQGQGAGATHGQKPVTAHGSAAGSSHRPAGSHGHRHHVLAFHGHRSHVPASRGPAAHGTGRPTSATPRAHGNRSANGHSAAAGKALTSAARGSSTTPAAATPSAATPSAATPSPASPAASTPAAPAVNTSAKSGEAHSK